MKSKALFRKFFDKILSSLPSFIHTGLLKSYAKMPELTLESGFRCFPQVFYSPLVDPSEVCLKKLETERNLPGITINEEEIFAFLKNLNKFTHELDWMPKNSRGHVPWQETYTTLDSSVLYCTIRHLKPRRIIEVGCGYSSGVSSKAVRRNREEGDECTISYIEPYPGARLDGIDLAGELVVKKVQEMPLSYFEQLEAGDIMFIDTSHVIKCQNDVEFELLYILPSLKPGVIIHIHDIYTPYDQPKDWLLDRAYPGHSNEQYAVESLLSGGGGFKVINPLYWLGKKHPNQAAPFMGGEGDRGQAIWISKK